MSDKYILANLDLDQNYLESQGPKRPGGMDLKVYFEVFKLVRRFNDYFLSNQNQCTTKKEGTCLEFLAKTTSGILHMYIVIKVNFKTEIDERSFISQLNHTFKP